MKVVWADAGVRVFGITTTYWSGTECWIFGTGTFNDRPFEWNALACPRGWLVEIIVSTGRLGQLDGNTFNLPLEVATAARRFM